LLRTVAWLLPILEGLNTLLRPPIQLLKTISIFYSTTIIFIVPVANSIPALAVACNDRLKELLTQRAIALPEKYGITANVYNGEVLYPYGIACKELGNVKYPKATLRRKRSPEQFRKLFGRNFITSKYLDLLKGYYDYKNSSNQLKLNLA